MVVPVSLPRKCVPRRGKGSSFFRGSVEFYGPISKLYGLADLLHPFWSCGQVESNSTFGISVAHQRAIEWAQSRAKLAHYRRSSDRFYGQVQATDGQREETPADAPSRCPIGAVKRLRLRVVLKGVYAQWLGKCCSTRAIDV